MYVLLQWIDRQNFLKKKLRSCPPKKTENRKRKTETENRKQKTEKEKGKEIQKYEKIKTQETIEMWVSMRNKKRREKMSKKMSKKEKNLPLWR